MLFHHDEPPLRDQLIDARAKITQQIHDLYARSGSCGGTGGPPDNRAILAELESELSQINALLDGDASPNP